MVLRNPWLYIAPELTRTDSTSNVLKTNSYRYSGNWNERCLMDARRCVGLHERNDLSRLIVVFFHLIFCGKLHRIVLHCKMFMICIYFCVNLIICLAGVRAVDYRFSAAEIQFVFFFYFFFFFYYSVALHCIVLQQTTLF